MLRVKVNLHSSARNFFSKKQRTYRRRRRHIVATTMQNVVTNQANPLALEGLSKFGVIPSGAGRAGALSSAARASGDILMAEIELEGTKTRELTHYKSQKHRHGIKVSCQLICIVSIVE